MPNLYVKFPLQNESTQPINIVLEPLAESFTIAPGERVEVHALCDDKTSNITFTLAPNDSFLTIYAPGEIAGFVDCYVTRDGHRLAPDAD